MIATDTSPDAATHGQPVPPKGLTARDLFALDRRTIIGTYRITAIGWPVAGLPLMLR